MRASIVTTEIKRRGGGEARGTRPARPLFLLCLLVALFVAGMIPATASAAVGFGAAGTTATTSNTTLRLSTPGGTSSGDLLLAVITRNGDGAVTAPSGWTTLLDTPQSTNMGQAVCYRVAGSSEGPSFDFTIDYGSDDARAVGLILRYTGVNQASPVSAWSANTGDSDDLIASSVAVRAGSMAVAVLGSDEWTWFTAPSAPTGMNSRARLNHSLLQGPALRVADQAYAEAGSTGDKTSSLGDIISSPWVAQLVALRPAATTITVTASASDKVYDGSDSADVTLASAGIIPGDEVTFGHTSAVFADKNVGTAKTVTVSGITLGGADAVNYTLAGDTTTASADITAKSLTATAAAENRTYDGTTTAAVTLSSTDVISGDTVTFSPSTGSFADKNVGDAKPVTVTGIALGGADAGNYELTSDTAGTTADVTAKALTATAAAENRTYDGTTVADVVLSSSDVISGDTVTISPSTGSFADKNVGDAKPVTVTGISIGGADAGNYELTSDTAGTTADITAKALTISGAVAEDKIYDGTADATVDFSAAKLEGVVAGDAVDIDSSGYAASFDNKDLGTDKPVTVTGVALAGTAAGNYTLGQPSGLTADITGVTPTITVSGNDDAWHAGPVTLTLTPTVGPYGIDKVEGKIGSGDWTAITPSEGLYRATITTEGVSTVGFRVTDNAGLVSDVGTCTVKIDSSAPTISMIGISGGDTTWHKDPVTLTFTPRVGGSGVASVEYMVNGGAWTAITAAAGAYQVTFAANGTYAVSYRTTDNAGLTSAAGNCTVKIDNAKPVAKAKKASVKKGKKAKLKLFVTKNPTGCGKAVVVVKFYKGKKLKKSMKTKYLTVNKWTTVKWKCKLAKGKYTMKLYTTDAIGNTQAKVGKAKLTVK